jgi:hypothetical protein
MKRLVRFVNPYHLFFFTRFTLHLHAVFCEGANYSRTPAWLARVKYTDVYLTYYA